jgi:hypothetical protein
MDFECFICSSPSHATVVRLSDDVDALKSGHGICHLCSIIVCKAHGQRVPGPPAAQYMCVLCVPTFIRKGGFPPLDPGDPTGPQTEIDQLIEAISFAPEPVLAKIRTALIEFMQRRKLKETAPVGQDGRNLAADIFSKEMGVTQFLREMNRRVVMEE